MCSTAERALYKAKGQEKSGNEDWVTGNFVNPYFIVSQMEEANEEYTILESWWPIDPKTLCQFTGLLDKNGNKIFEGDEVIWKKLGFIGYVYWNHDDCSFYVKTQGTESFVDSICELTGENIHDV